MGTIAAAGLCDITKAMANASLLGIAHRGASAYAPENTVAAFDEAIRLGAAAIEFDVRVTADGVPVVLHDETVDRTTNGRGRVNELTRLELLRLDAGSWKHPRFAGTRIPTLAEALAAVDDLAIPVLELKTAVSADILADLLAEFAMTDRAVVLAFEADMLAPLRPALPNVRIGLLADVWTSDLPQRCIQAGAGIIAADIEILTLERVGQARVAGLEVWTYTVNDAGTIAACAALGVTGVITDYPDLIRTRAAAS